MTSLCVGCGICCDGTMYKSVDLYKNDRPDLLEEAGLVLSNDGAFDFFRLPCTSFAAGCCKIYEIRPTVCAEYRCLLLRRLEAGEIPYADALALVEKTTAIRDRVRSGLNAYLETDDRVPLSELYRRMLAKLDSADDPAAARREQRELLFDVVALRVILARDFEPRDSKSHVPDEVAAELQSISTAGSP